MNDILAQFVYPLIIGLAASLPGILAYVAQKRTIKSTNTKQEGEAVSALGEGVESSAKAVDIYAERCIKLQGEIDNLRNELNAIRQEINEVKKERDEVKDWAARLVYQVRSLGHEPVPFKAVELKK